MPQTKVKEEDKKQSKFSEDPTDVLWLNITKSGNGMSISVGKDFYVTSLKAVKAVVDKDKKGAKFTKLLPIEE